MNYINQHSDKVAHFLGGYFICTVTAHTTIGLIMAVIAGLAKEIIVDDTPDYWDAFWTFVGGVIGILVWGRR